MRDVSTMHVWTDDDQIKSFKLEGRLGPCTRTVACVRLIMHLLKQPTITSPPNIPEKAAAFKSHIYTTAYF